MVSELDVDVVRNNPIVGTVVPQVKTSLFSYLRIHSFAMRENICLSADLFQ